MNRIKALSIGIGILSLLIIFVLVFQWWSDRSDDQDRSRQEEFLISFDMKNVDKVSFEGHDNINYQLLRESDIVEQSSWRLETNDSRFSSVAFDQNRIYSSLTLLGAISADRIVTDVSDFAQYGLDSPRMIISVHMRDGQVLLIHFGNLSVDGEYIYTRVDDNDEVFLISSAEYDVLTQSELNYINKSFLNIPYADIEYFEYYRRFDDLNAVIYASAHMPHSGIFSADWYFTAPINWPAGQGLKDIILEMSFLEVERYYFNDDPVIESLRLEESDYAFVFFDISGRADHIDLFEVTGERFFGYSSHLNLYFSFERSKLTGMQSPVVSYLNNRLTPFAMHEVDSIECDLPEGSFLITIEKEDDEPISSNFTHIYIDGRNAKVQDMSGVYYFEFLYRSIASMSLYSFDYDMIHTREIIDRMDPIITIIIRSHHREPHEYAFYDIGDELLYLCIDGQYQGLTVSQDSFYYFDPDDLMKSGVWDAYVLLLEALDAQSGGIYDISGQE